MEDRREAFRWLIRQRAVADAVLEVDGDPVAVYRAWQMAQKLMAEHGCTDWELRIGTGVVVGGNIRYNHHEGTKLWDGKPGVFTLSGPLMSLWTEEQQRLLILHEIAHILCPDAGHGPVWRAMCRRLGIQPKRLYGEDGETMIRQEPKRRPRPWVGSCPGGHKHTRAQRPDPGKRLCCLLCSRPASLLYEIVWRYEQGE